MKIPKKVQASVGTQIKQLEQATIDGIGKYKYLSCERAYQLLDVFCQFEDKIDEVETDQFVNQRDWEYICNTLYHNEDIDCEIDIPQSITKFLERVIKEYELYS
jgi:hypothetical protein